MYGRSGEALLAPGDGSGGNIEGCHPEAAPGQFFRVVAQPAANHERALARACDIVLPKPVQRQRVRLQISPRHATCIAVGRLIDSLEKDGQVPIWRRVLHDFTYTLASKIFIVAHTIPFLFLRIAKYITSCFGSA